MWSKVTTMDTVSQGDDCLELGMGPYVQGLIS